MKLSPFFIALLIAGDLSAQSQQMVVDAVTSPTTATKPVAVQPAKGSDASGEVAKALESARAANAELLRRQETTLQALDELQKEADQIRIYSKRG